MSFSLSKKIGNPIFVIMDGKNKGKKIKLNPNHNVKKDGEPITEYDTGEQLQLLPLPKNQSFTMVVSGPRGSGKSYFASKFVKQYKKKYPKNPVYLVSAKKEDESLDRLNVHRIKMNRENFVDDPIDLDELKDSLIVFDDVERVPKDDKDIKIGVDNLKNKILLQGRSNNISIIIVCHLLYDYRNTTIQNYEVDHFTFFPCGGAQAQIQKFLKTSGLSNQQIQEILTCRSRHVTFNKAYPMWYLTTDKFKLL